VSERRVPIPGLQIESQPDDLLAAMLVWGEARGESHISKEAIIWVVKNRVAAHRFGSTLRQVILKPYAFSCLNHARPGEVDTRAQMLDPLAHDLAKVWDECCLAAEMVMDGQAPDPTHGATHYVRDYLWGDPTPPGHAVQWYHQIEIEAGRTVETARIGHHVFARAA